MIPNTSVRPAASRNSMTPSWRPLRICSNTRVIKKEARSARASCSAVRRPLPLHLAVLAVRILVVRENGLLHLHDRIRACRRAGDRLEQIVVLDREMIVVEGELAARGFEIRL